MNRQAPMSNGNDDKKLALFGGNTDLCLPYYNALYSNLLRSLHPESSAPATPTALLTIVPNLLISSLETLAETFPSYRHDLAKADIDSNTTLATSSLPKFRVILEEYSNRLLALTFPPGITRDSPKSLDASVYRTKAVLVRDEVEGLRLALGDIRGRLEGLESGGAVLLRGQIGGLMEMLEGIEGRITKGWEAYRSGAAAGVGKEQEEDGKDACCGMRKFKRVFASRGKRGRRGSQ